LERDEFVSLRLQLRDDPPPRRVKTARVGDPGPAAQGALTLRKIKRRSMLRLYVRGFAQAELAGKDSQSINVWDRSAFKLNLPYLAIDLFALCALY
jgi:hypothetical protein